MLGINRNEGEKLKKEQELLNYEGEDKLICLDEAKERLKIQKEKLCTFHSNIKSLDKYIQGFEAGELIIISGPTKHGKTTLSKSLSKNFSEQGIKTLWFEFEVTPLQFVFSFPDSIKEIYLPAQLKYQDISWIKERILEGKIKYGIRIIFIDHLHYLIDLYHTRNPSLDIGTIIRELKKFAVDEDLVVFAMAHTTKIKLDKSPTEEDIRDSSFIAQEADSTFMVWREVIKNRKGKNKEYTGETYLIITNHRRTGVMGERIKLFFKDGFLYEAGVDNSLLTQGLR